MIRHSSAFFISMMIHIALVLLFFLLYTTVLQQKSIEEDSQEHIQIQLSNISSEKPLQQLKQENIQQQIIQEVKKITKKPIVTKDKKPVQEKVVQQVAQVEEKVELNKETLEQTVMVKNEPSTKHKETEKDKSLRLQGEYLNKHLQKITQLLSENLYYPRSARKRGLTDKVMVKFTLSPLGEVLSLQVINSQTDILADAAKETINNLSGKFPQPEETLTLHVPIEYKLK